MTRLDTIGLDEMNPAAVARALESARRREAYAYAAADHALERGARFNASLQRAKAKRATYEAQRIDRALKARRFADLALGREGGDA